MKFVTGRTRTLTPEQWSIEQGGATLCSRTQIPLDLAWALRYFASLFLRLNVERTLVRVFTSSNKPHSLLLVRYFLPTCRDFSANF